MKVTIQLQKHDIYTTIALNTRTPRQHFPWCLAKLPPSASWQKGELIRPLTFRWVDKWGDVDAESRWHVFLLMSSSNYALR